MPDHLGRAGAPGRLVDELAVRGVGQRDRAGRGLEHAGRGADDRLHDAPVRRRAAEALGQRVAARSLSGTPIASAKASAEEIRFSGSISRPPASAVASSGGRPGASLSSLSTSP